MKLRSWQEGFSPWKSQLSLWWSCTGQLDTDGAKDCSPIGYKVIILEFQQGYLLFVQKNPTRSVFLAWCHVNLASCSPCWWLSYCGGVERASPSPLEVALVRGWKSSTMHRRLLVPRARAELLALRWSFLTRRQCPLPSRSGTGDRGEDKGREVLISFLLSWKSEVAATSERQMLSSPHYR